MTGTEALDGLFTDLNTRGIRLRLEGGLLRYTSPPGALTPELRAQLQASKAAVIERLRTAPPSVAPTSFPQRRFWELQRLNPEEPFYNDPFLFRLRGPLDTGILLRCFNAIVARHEILRTTLQQRDGELMQLIAPAGEIDWVEADVRQEVSPAAAATTLLRREVRRPFDLGRDAGLRTALVRTADEEHLLQVNFHNTVFDLFSLTVVLNELSLHYSAFAAGQSPQLQPPAQYSEYVQWQQSVLITGMEERREYWHEWFRHGDPPAWTWMSQKSAPDQPGFESHVNWVRRSPERSAQFHAMCRRHGVTPYIAVLAAYFLTVRHYTGCADLTIGTTYSNRHGERFASMIGATILVPSLRMDSSDDPSMAVLLGRVRDVLAAALTHQDVPVDQVIARDSKRPLFRVVCSAFPETPQGKLRLPGIEAIWLEDWINDVSRPDLYMVMWENQSSLTCHTMHKRDVFEPETAAAMVGLFESALDAMMKDATQTASAILASC